MPLVAEMTTPTTLSKCRICNLSLVNAASLPRTGMFTLRTTADRVKLADLPHQPISLPGAVQNKHSKLTKSPKGITTRGPSPLMSIHLVEAPGWLCTIYGTTKAKKASISTRTQPRILIRFFKYLDIYFVLAQLFDSAFDTVKVVANTSVEGQINSSTDESALRAAQLSCTMCLDKGVHSNSSRLTKVQHR